MPTMYTTGPVLVWVGPQLISPTQYLTLAALPPVYLGTAEVSPQAEERVQMQPAYNDLAGAVPFDLNFLGSDAVVAVDLTRWDERVMATLERLPNQMAVGTLPRGSYSAFGGMGALQAHFGNTMTVYLVFPYGSVLSGAGNVVMQAAGLPAGYRFHGVSRINTKLHQMGNKYKKTHLTFQAAPIYNFRTGVFTLFDNPAPSIIAPLVTAA